jgi:DNA-binding NarL/FixJ family response regulator
VTIIPIKVLLADDTQIVRQAIRRLLDAQPEIELVGEAADFAQTIQMANDLKPQVIVMDLHMPNDTNLTPLDVQSRLHQSSRLLAISIWNDEETRALAKRFGAAALLDKTDLGKKLIPAIRQLVLPSGGADLP